MEDNRRPIRATSDEEKGLVALRRRLGQVQYVLSRVLERSVDTDVEWAAEALIRELYGADVAALLKRRRGSGDAGGSAAAVCWEAQS